VGGFLFQNSNSEDAILESIIAGDALPAKDRYHDTVVRALVKDGWTVTHHQFNLDVEERSLWVDIRAVKEARSLVILVEVKGFENMASAIRYLASAIGQYVLYL